MIYLDSSVALAQLLVEDRRPPDALWGERLIASRLLEYEVWCRLHAHGLGVSRGADAREVLARVSFVELSPLVLSRALQPFPVAVRTFDALHLASVDFLRERRLEPRLATYDARMIRSARAMDIEIVDLN